VDGLDQPVFAVLLGDAITVARLVLIVFRLLDIEVGEGVMPRTARHGLGFDGLAV
jgi:hypothetical protein